MKNRRELISTFLLGAMALTFHVDAGKKKGKGKGKGQQKSRARTIETKKTGTIYLEKKGLNENYRLLADKSYIISRSVVEKIQEYEGQRVTIFGRFFLSKDVNKVVKIGGITTGGKSP